MAEFVVDCDIIPHPTEPDRSLVLPISINGHVHERIIRCKDCDYCSMTLPHYCRAWHTQVYKLDGFCHRAVPRGGDG